jgi:hypothetical protein
MRGLVTKVRRNQGTYKSDGVYGNGEKVDLATGFVAEQTFNESRIEVR